MHIAASCNDVQVVKFLAEKKVYSGSQFKEQAKYNIGFNSTAFGCGVVTGKYENLKVLKAAGLDYINFKETGIHNGWKLAYLYGDKKSLESLDKIGFTPNKREILRAFEEANEQIVNELIKRYPQLIEKEKTKVLRAISLNSVKYLYKIYDKKIKLNQESLYNLVEKREDSLVKQILDEKFYDGAINLEKLLTEAVDVGDFSMVKFLIAQGANINKLTDTDYGKYNAVHVAAHTWSADILKYLIEMGGDVRMKTSKGKTPYDIAKEVDNPENVSIIKNQLK